MQKRLANDFFLCLIRKFISSERIFFCGHLVNKTMAKPLKTSIHITEFARPDYDKMSARYSAKLSVSAGIMLLARLKAEQRESIIDEANGIISPAEAARQDEAAAARDVKADKRRKAPRKTSRAG